MKRTFWGLWIIGLIGFVFSGILFGQNTRNDKAATAASSLYVISAKAGVVNFTSGKVSVVRLDSKSGYLSKGDNLEVGDKVSTGVDGKAEILLNPGSFVRLGENSNFEFLTTSLDDLQLKLNSGSSIFEVIADNQFQVTVDTGKTKFYLVKSGIYRVDVSSAGVGKISVWKGKAEVDDNNASVIKSGQSASIDDEQTAVAKFDRGNKDDLEIWSKSRAKEIAKVNENLIERKMNMSLLSSFGQNMGNSFSGYGLWVFDASYGGACFFPFSYGASSPYGYGYQQTIWSYPGPASYFYSNSPYLNNRNINNQNGNGQYPNVNQPIQTPPIQTPPMNGGGGRGDAGNSFPGSTRSTGPIMSPPIDTAPSRSTMPERRQESQSAPMVNKRVD